MPRCQLLQDWAELADHQLVIDYYGHLLALPVVLHCLSHQLQMLLLRPQVVVNYHLHVHPVVPLLQQSLPLLVIGSPFDLHPQFPLNGLHVGLSPLDSGDGLGVSLHLAVDCCLVEVGRNDIVFLLARLRFDQFFFQFDCEVDSTHRYSILPLLLIDAGQVVKAEHLQLTHYRGIPDVLLYLGHHQQRDALVQQPVLFLELRLFSLQCLHGQLVDFLDKIDDELLDWRQLGQGRVVGVGKEDVGVDEFFFQQQAGSGELSVLLKVVLSDTVHQQYGGDVQVVFGVVFHCQII